jgi:NADPH-dependent F420 reductase
MTMDFEMSEDSVISVVGGTGNLGAAIARRLAKAGRKVIIGSRSAESAAKAAAELGFGITGMANAEAAKAGDIVIVTVPFAAQEATLAEIKPHVQGKIVVDTTVPLVPPKVMRVQLPPEGSAAVKAQGLLGEGVTVVSGFHNVAAHKLITDQDIDCDILVFGDEKAARAKVVELADASGLRGVHGGALVNSAAAEAMTSLLIFINKTYQVDGAGIRITGQLVPPDAPSPA